MNSRVFQKRLLALQTNMLNFAFMLTSNRDDAYDLIQDTILRALDNEDKYVENTNFKGWVFTIMRNIFINNYRRQVRAGVRVGEGSDDYRVDISYDSSFSNPDNSFALSDVQTAINRFAPGYRIPFSMHLAGYHYVEIAEYMNLPVGTIKSRIYYVRQRLRRELKDYRSEGRD